MVNYKLTLAYDGTNYSGFQVQQNALTVQEVLENSLKKIFKEKVRVTGAGRTDAHVHARGQVISFQVQKPIPCHRLPLALNSLLPRDIVVYQALEVSLSFDACRDARAKLYVYTLDNGLYADAFLRNYAWHLPFTLDLEVMRQGAAFLVGRHDFKAFQAAGSSVEKTIRQLETASIEQQGRLISFSFKGDGFLYKMVRNMVGTLVDMGLSRKKPGEMPVIIESKNRQAAGRTAPARGLCLQEVFY